MVTQAPIKPGLYRNVPFAEYRRWPIMSQSALKQGRESMRHLKHALTAESKPPTDAMLLGSALHTAFLEPEEFDNRVALWKGLRRAGKEWDAFCDANRGKIILTPGFHEQLVGMVTALREDPRISEWSGRTQAVEVSCVGEICGVPFKGRIDAMTEDPLWDLKKTVSTSDRAINNTILTYGYHIQAYCYRELFGRDRFCLGFVEEQPPHDVRVVELSPAWMKIGEQEALGLLQRYQWCVKNNQWPGRSETIDVVEPPSFLSDLYSGADEITIGGEGAFGKE